MKTTEDPVTLFAAAVSFLEEELPWGQLGPLYCDGGGEDFFGSEAVEALREAGLKIASDLGQALEVLGEPGSAAAGVAGRSGRGKSLYFGAAVAELIPAVCETILLGRSVRLINLPGPEPELINGALERAEQRLATLGSNAGGLLPRIEINQRALERGRFDHLWVTSVFSDPEAFPALHDELYDLLPRKGSQPSAGKVRTGRGNLPLERKRARELMRRLVARLVSPALVTTSEEELPLLESALAERGLAAAPSTRPRLSAIVGDPICSYAIRG